VVHAGGRRRDGAQDPGRNRTIGVGAVAELAVLVVPFYQTYKFMRKHE
jgi:hypothetical protein